MLDVFKRILATALGAMGLGALAAVPAFAQDATPGSGNIPAPDLFDPQITCSMNVPSMDMRPMPSVTPEGADDSPSGHVDRYGRHDARHHDSGKSWTSAYVIPPGTQNCGGPAGMAFNAADIVGSGTVERSLRILVKDPSPPTWPTATARCSLPIRISTATPAWRNPKGSKQRVARTQLTRMRKPSQTESRSRRSIRCSRLSRL